MLLREINNATKSVRTISILANGRALRAFTIERSEMLIISKTIAIDYPSYIVLFLLRLLRLDMFFNLHNIRELLVKKTHLSLMNQASDATYLVDYRENFSELNGRTYNLTVTCNALYMYPDTLPLFYMDPTKPYKIERENAFKPLQSAALSIAFTLFLGIFSNYYLNKLADDLVASMPIEKEAILWSYIQDSVYQEISDRSDILKAQSALQALLDQLQSYVPDKRYDYKVLIADDENINIEIYPMGNIVVTKGFVEKLKSKEQAIYALAHMIGHLEKMDHLYQLDEKVLTFDLIAATFGADSWLGKLVVWRSDFDVEYSLQEELHSDQFALALMDHIYGSIGGLDIFEESFYQLTNSYIKLFSSHPFDIARVDSVKQFIEKQGYKFSENSPIELNIENPQEQTKISTLEVENNDKFITLFYDYRVATNQVYNEYQAFLKQYNNIASFKNQITLSELNDKKALIEHGLIQIPTYKARFAKIFSEYEAKLKRLIADVQDSNQKHAILEMWNQEFTQIKTLSSFYLKRDTDVLNNQLVLLNFLIARHGSYQVTQTGLKFKTDKERLDYINLQKRIESIIKTPPPQINNP
jgi:Zn-dependent protease with chaperone function